MSGAILVSMKRWRVIFVVVLAALVVGGIYRAAQQKAQQQREATYQQKLRSYADALRKGMSRRDVELYLRSRSILYSQIGTGDQKAATLITKIGEEAAPWYCSERNIYVAMEFTPVRQHDPWDGDDSDILSDVRISRWDQSCL